MELSIITSGFLPVPATKGGAVENLIENFIKKNEEYKKINLTIFSIKDNEIMEISNKYKYTNFIFIEPNLFIKILDKFTFFIAKNILKKEKIMSYRYIFQRLYYLNKVSKYLRDNEYDKILLENHPTLFMALKMKKNHIKYKNKYYYHLHNEITNTYGCDEIIKNCKKNICVSKFISNQLSEFLGVKDKEKFSVLKNCIDEEKFKEKISEDKIIELKNKYNIKADEKVLLFTGRLTREKGIKELLLSLKYLKNTDYKLLVVGSFFFGTDVKSKFEEELEEIIKELRDKVEFTGFIPYDQIRKIYAITDIAILPSICNDSAPLTIIEALTCGIPIITTYSGGIPEYVNEKCSFIHRRDENLIKNLSISIDKLIEDENLRKKMGKESLEAAKELTLDNYYLNFVEMLGVSDEGL